MARTQRPRPGEELLAPFRVLAGGEDRATAGTALLERACRALAAAEGAILFQEGGFAPGPCWGPAEPGGRLGARPCVRGQADEAVAAGRPLAA
ncbi:MAG: hypothetical protein ACJ75K_24425, partial [Actinomycetes bacterium]